MTTRTLLLWLALVFSARAASPYANLYDDATLRKWQPSFEEDLTWNLRNVILAKLTPEEQRALSGVKLEVPLRGKQGSIFEFYAEGNRVVMPALSLRFFADLSLAYAWLNENGYNTGTVQQYVGMITYRSASQFPGGYPRPLDALQIPVNARDHAGVMQVMGKSFTSAMIFILCHELGHIYHRHPGYGPGVPMAQARRNEAEADRFAVSLMRRAREFPAGVLFWFANLVCAERQRVDFVSAQAWQDYLDQQTHPLTAERIEALAKAIEDAADDFAYAFTDPARGRTQTRVVAGDIRKIGQTLKDEDLHRLFRTQSATATVKTLAPRRTVAYEAEADRASFSNEPFSGVFQCVFSSKQNNESIDLRLVLRREADRVTGEYTYGTAMGRITGSVTGTTLYFTWIEGGLRGKGALTWGEDGKSFSGTWGSRESRDDGGNWTGVRR